MSSSQQDEDLRPFGLLEAIAWRVLPCGCHNTVFTFTVRQWLADRLFRLVHRGQR